MTAEVTVAQPTQTSLEIGIEYEGGGEGRVISELHKFLPSENFRIVGAVSGPKNVAALTGGDFTNFAPEATPKLQRFSLARKTLKHLLQVERPDVVSSHFALYAWPIVDKLKSRPFVHHFHGPWSMESRQDGASLWTAILRTRSEGFMYRRADIVIVLSQAFADLVVGQFGVQRDRVRIVPGSVDVKRFAPSGSKQEARLRLGLDPDAPTLVAIRRLVRRMGLLELVTAMQSVVSRVPEAQLYIAGRGLLEAELRSRIENCGLQKNVRLLGFVKDDDLPFLYRAADVNIVPTRALEGFGLVAAESLAAGTPALVTAVGGLPDVVRNLCPDLIFESGEPHAMAEKIVATLRGSLHLPSENDCVQYAESNFNSVLMAARTASVYREVL